LILVNSASAQRVQKRPESQSFQRGITIQKSIDADYFIAKAEECFRLANLDRDVAKELKKMGQEFMAKAVELDTRRDKSVKKIRAVNHDNGH
jgi:hypothetical protein